MSARGNIWNSKKRAKQAEGKGEEGEGEKSMLQLQLRCKTGTNSTLVPATYLASLPLGS